MFRPALSRSCIVEHTAKSGAIYVSSMHTKADDPAGVLIHYYHDPVWLQGDRLSTEKIYAPQAVFCVTDYSQPGGSTIIGIWFEMNSEHLANCVLVQLKTESQVDLLSNAGTSVSRVALLHLDDGHNDFPGWALGT